MLPHHQAWAFTQGAGVLGQGGTPMGHEWLTVRAASELITPSIIAANDPRKSQQTYSDGTRFNIATANDPSVAADAMAWFTTRKLNPGNTQESYYISTYGVNYHNVVATVVGERWVDIGGFNVTKSKANSFFGQPDCFDAVAQLPDDLQHDHFCRQRDEAGGAGAIAGITDSAQRFQEYFVAAAVAPDGDVLLWDGGIFSAEATVDRHFLLLGRALHLLQDSFSLEHSVRRPVDGFRNVHGMKTYLCTLASDQHSHAVPAAPLQTFNSSLYTTNGDVIWKSQGNDWTPTNMKPNAIAALEATKDLFAAFLRTMMVPANQRGSFAAQQAATLAATWFSFDPAEVTARYAPGGSAQTEAGSTYVTDQAACDNTIGGAPVIQKIDNDRAKCIKNIAAFDASGNQVTPGPDDIDEHLGIPFHWNWTSIFWNAKQQQQEDAK